MANRYYLLDLGELPAQRAARLSAALERFARKPGVRTRAEQIGHYALSRDGRLAIFQAEVEPDDEAWIAQRGDMITSLGERDPVTGTSQAALDYIAAHPDDWTPE